MEVARQLNDFSDVVVRVLLVRCVDYSIEQGLEILIRYRKLFEQAVLLEKSETKVKEHVLFEKLAILEDVEIPFVEVGHDLQNLGPLSSADIDEQSESFFVLLNLGLVHLPILSVQLFQKVIQVAFKPNSRVVGLLGRDPDPLL